MKTILETDDNFICDIKAPCFQTLGPDEVELVRSAKTQVHFRKGDNLTKQGAFASYVLFLIDGLVKQYLEGDNNKLYNLKIFQQGDFVGLSSAFSKSTFDYSTVALTDCMAFLIEKEAIGQVVRQNGFADFAGISTESAVKLLKSFEKDGLIQLKDKDVIVLDFDKLHEISLRG